MSKIPAQGNMEVQTDGRNVSDMSTGADFGPEKPRRVDFRDENEYEPLLQVHILPKLTNIGSLIHC
jgi:hypothetical protein